MEAATALNVTSQDIFVQGIFRKDFTFPNLPSGIYFLEIRKNDGNIDHKIVIQK
jgi:hypothetical protein